jgi:hypothetical protein
MRTFYMLRNTFLALAVLSVLVAAAPSQAATTLGAAGDSKTSVAYNAATGGFTLQPMDRRLAFLTFNPRPAFLPAASRSPILVWG